MPEGILGISIFKGVAHDVATVVTDPFKIAEDIGIDRGSNSTGTFFFDHSLEVILTVVVFHTVDGSLFVEDVLVDLQIIFSQIVKGHVEHLVEF